MSEDVPRYTETQLTVRQQNEEAFDEMVDALDHIFRVARSGRTNSRRDRWIAERARCAIEGGRDWRDINIPKIDPRIRKAEKQIADILPHVQNYIEAIREADSIDGVIEDQEVIDELDELESFVAFANRLPAVRRQKTGAEHCLEKGAPHEPEDEHATT